MNFEIQGKIILIEDIVQISQTFKKREFVIEVENERNSDWNDFIKFQITQDKCALLDEYKLGESINVNFNIKGRKWEKNGKVNYITNLEAWRVGRANGQNQESNVEVAAAPAPAPDVADSGFPTEEDDLPF